MSDFIDEKKDTVLRKVWTWYKNLKKWKKIILWICIIPLLLIWFWGDIKGKISNAGELSQAIFTEVKPKKELEKGYRYRFLNPGDVIEKDALLLLQADTIRADSLGIYFVKQSLLSERNCYAKVTKDGNFCCERELPLNEQDIVDLNLECQ